MFIRAGARLINLDQVVEATSSAEQNIAPAGREYLRLDLTMNSSELYKITLTSDETRRFLEAIDIYGEADSE